ncbi:adenylyl-sulfate kinase [Humidesulfovibrio idahonensis]
MPDGESGIYWLTGLSSSGKTTLARAAGVLLATHGVKYVILDGDLMREGLCADLGFSPEDRNENIRRAGEVARLMSRQGLVCLCAFITPFRAMRDQLQARLGGAFHEIYVQCPLEICMARDPKGFYRRANSGEVQGYTGVGAPYEPPLNPELRVETSVLTIAEATQRILEHILRTES